MSHVVYQSINYEKVIRKGLERASLIPALVMRE